MIDRVLFCVGPDADGNLGKCPRPVSGHGEDACESHRRQLSRTGKMVPIAEKISPFEHMLNLFDRIAEADGEEEYAAARRSFAAELDAQKRRLTPAELQELVRKDRSESTRRGMEKAKAEGKHVGRPSLADRQDVERLLAKPVVELVAMLLNISKRTLYAKVQKGTLSAKTPRETKRHTAPRPRSRRGSASCR